MARCPVWSSWALPPTCKHACNGEWPQFSDRTCVIIRTKIYLTVIPSNCSCLVTFCFLLAQLILDSVLVSAPGLGRLGSCAVCSGPQLYSRQPAHSLTSQKHPTLKNDPTFCVASFSARQNDQHAVEKSVKRWNMSVESCRIVLVCVLSDWQDCQVPLTNHLLPFQIRRTLGKKVSWVKEFGNQSEQNVASVLSRSGEACHQRNGQVILQEGNHCVFVYCRK